MPTHCPTCRVKRRYRKKRAAFCTSIPTHPGQFDSQFEHQVSIGFKRIDYRTVRAQVKRRHRFENSTASKRLLRLLSAMKKGHCYEKSNLPVVIYDNPHGFSFARIKPGRSIERYFFFSPSKLFQSLTFRFHVVYHNPLRFRR